MRLVVFNGMTQVKASPDTVLASLGDTIIVPGPRPCDAVGSALRKAFTPEAALPLDFVRSLNVIDTIR